MLEELTKMISDDEPEQQEKQFFFMEDLNFGCCCWIVHEVNTHSQRELKRVTKKKSINN